MIKKKRILFETGHPAQVHQFNAICQDLVKKGHEVLIAAKRKEISEFLLNANDLPYVIIDETRKGMVSKIFNLPALYFSLYKVIRSFKPDIIVSRFSFQASHLAWLLRIPHIGFTDTEHINLSDNLTVPFVDVKLTAKSYLKELGKNHYRYDGNIELFYLHPDRFTPDPSIKKKLGLKENERFAIIRFVSWGAHHDLGQEGFSIEFKKDLVEKLSKHMRVFITSEEPLSEDFQKYQISIPPDEIHSALAFADLYIGEGGTMASEAACLGTPSIYVNSLDAGVFQDEEKFELLHSFRNSEGALEKAMEIASDPEVKKKYKSRLKDFMATKINVTSFVAWFIENYPDSFKTLKDNPDTPDNFR